MRLAVIADIHANVLALEAVLADIKVRGADLVVDLGDCVSGPLWPRETCELLETLKLPTVRGNHERQLTGSRDAMGQSDAFAYDQLTTAQLQRLGALPLTLTPIDGVLMCHASPDADDRMLMDRELPEGGFVLASPADIAARVARISANLLLTAHTHVPRVVSAQRKDAEPLTIVNPGSAGCPGFEHQGRCFQIGSPHARYAILTRSADRWQVEHIAVAYDWDAASRRAASNNRPEWARALATGFAAPL